MASQVHQIDVSNPREILVDRELSWLAFNQRVLELAEDKSTPLLERCRFLAIFSSNLDDFYMIRVASLKNKLETGIAKANTAGFTPTELMKELSIKTEELISRKSKCFHEDVYLKLSKEGINIVRWDELNSKERELATDIFHKQIFPVLTPLAIDPSHPFPYISGLSLNLAVIVKNPDTEIELFARVKVPSNLARFVVTSNGDDRRYIPLEQVITANIAELFPGMEISNVYTFRITRNADLELEEEESEDLLASMEQELLRRKFGPPVRLEVGLGMDDELLETLKEELKIKDEDISKYPEPLDLTGLNQIADIDRPDLKFEAFRSQVAWDLRDVEPDSTEAFFEAIKRREIILHHPYESFSSSVVRFIESAATDPHVLAIKQTLYRTSGDSPIVEALIEAAEAGKQVLAVIEIRARFDEQANVRWARKLEDAGVHVVYGLVGFKTHAKLSLVVRQESGAIRRYVHMGTGNYNPKTARMYEDFGILSTDPVLGDDVNKLFNQLSGFAPQTSFERLLVAPRTLRSGLLAKIQREIDNKNAGKSALIRMKLNSILDEEFVDLLYKASAAGVQVELVVRGICAIRGGVPGLSENIRVISVLGRFLEHSRIFHFANDGENELWLGSADLMHRNLDRRVESMVMIKQTDHKRMLLRALDSYLAPTTAHWSMNIAGTWDRITKDSNGTDLTDLHQQVINWYRARG
ncbi:MAG: RNA degradosome polyphosphate kinase [Actinobacteria bacterium]|nr:RNA degradosome polyphosphate kinase [Actinomycetota bacterium]MDA2981899.1 RNA degradosome polyphosphate kinase [Actinomycetota bacterium]MDA2996813.1 RNA degradosome polyphosphate kinase [Actinomycetota bacterium]